MSPAYLLILATAFLLSLLSTRFLVLYLSKKGLIDIPNHRSSHQIPTPRGGGIAIIISILLGLILTKVFIPELNLPHPLYWSALLLVALTGFLDDKFSLPVHIRFSLHILAALLVIYHSGGLSRFPLPEPYSFSLGWINYPLTVFWIIAVMNIYNFLDGIDGYAASQTALAGLALAVLNPTGFGYTIGGMLLVASLGFLKYNWHPAKIFMGDIGSATLGFLFATIPFYLDGISSSLGIFSMGIFLWFFLSDGAFTIIKRLINGEKIWEAHRSHLYQQLVLSGLRHDQVVWPIMLATLLLITIHFILYYFYPDCLILSLLIAPIFFLVYYLLVKKQTKTSTQNT